MFNTDRSQAIFLLEFFFVCASVVSYVAFIVFMFLFSPSLGALGRQSLVIVSFHVYLYHFAYLFDRKTTYTVVMSAARPELMTTWIRA